MKTKSIIEWEEATEKLSRHFIKRYFDDPTDTYWIANDIGGVLEINDYFFSLNDMVNYLKYGYSETEMFEHYNYILDMGLKNETALNIRHYGMEVLRKKGK